MSDNGKLNFAASIDAALAADYLNRIAEGLRVGAIGLSAGTNTVRLTPGGMVKFAVAARGKAGDGRGSLSIELAWKLQSKPAAPPLEITSELDAPASNDIPVDVVSAAEED